MSRERVFNIFLYFDGGVATQYGVRHHQVAGDDQAKTQFLLSRIDEDHGTACRFLLSRSFTPREWLSVLRLGQQLSHFEEALQTFVAPAAPVFCLTSIVDGTPNVDRQIGAEAYQGDVVTAEEGRGAMLDYLQHYSQGNTFRFTELIDDDYFKAIRTLFNAKLYVSCSKLLMSCVDTLAFVEFGDTQRYFISWLDAFVDLKPLGVSSVELWEFRNSVLHMTNLGSRKVISGQVSPIVPYVGGPASMPRGSLKPFNLYELMKAIAEGIGKWAESYNSNPSKMPKFVDRYDATISDSRVAWIAYDGKREVD